MTLTKALIQDPYPVPLPGMFRGADMFHDYFELFTLAHWQRTHRQMTSRQQMLLIMEILHDPIYTILSSFLRLWYMRS